jgi:hypothetical protein
MRIVVIVPDRGDRPEFMRNCQRMIEAQTISPVRVIYVDYPPKSTRVDITERYRAGYEIVNEMSDVDVIAFMENDDWYAPDYLEFMTQQWEIHEKPELFGPVFTIYYNLRLKKYFKFLHIQQSSMMCTLMKPKLNFNWPKDHDPYTDQWLWMGHNGLKIRKTFEPSRIVCVSMKHGVGLTGGRFHTDKLLRYINDDEGFLQHTLDAESNKFYSGLVFD